MAEPVPTESVPRLSTGRAGRRLPALLVGRVVEQVALGGAALLLAARLGTEAFAPIGVLLILNSAAVTLSDYGVGLAVLRCAPGERVEVQARRGMRAIDASLAIAGAGAGVAIGGVVGTVVAAGAVVWWAAAEAFVAKAAAINAGEGQRAAVAEVLGALAFAVPVVVFATGASAVGVFGLALVVKHVVEAVLAHAPGAFAPGGTRPDLGALWGTQVVAFLLGNVDYFVVGALLGAASFSVYTLGYRVTSAAPSVLAYVATRTSVADLSSSSDAGERRLHHHRYVRVLFALGLAGVLPVLGLAFALPAVLGHGWQLLRPTILVLAVAMPWRMVAGQAGSLAIACGAARALLRWETLRLVLFAAVLALAALAGYQVFVATVAVAWIVGVLALHRGAAGAAGIAVWPGLRRAAFASAATAIVFAALLWGL